MTESETSTPLALAYLDALAGTLPTPGGGSASAVTGAIGVSLLEMVAGLSLKSSDVDRQEALTAILDRSHADRLRFIELGSEDERAYGGFRDALAMPKSTDEEKASRRNALQIATIESARVPLAIAGLAVNDLQLIPRLAAVASPYLRSDLATAAHLLAAAGNGAIVMVDTNLPSIKDEATRLELTTQRNRLIAAITENLIIALGEAE